MVHQGPRAQIPAGAHTRAMLINLEPFGPFCALLKKVEPFWAILRYFGLLLATLLVQLSTLCVDSPQEAWSKLLIRGSY